MNVDGLYWKPEQYPKTTCVAAKNLQLTHPPYLVSLVLTLLSLMNPLMQTINCSGIRMAKCFPGILVLTAGMGYL